MFSRSQRTKPRSPPPRASPNARAWSMTLSRFAATCSPCGCSIANSTSRVPSSTARTRSGSGVVVPERGERGECAQRVGNGALGSVVDAEVVETAAAGRDAGTDPHRSSRTPTSAAPRPLPRRLRGRRRRAARLRARAPPAAGRTTARPRAGRARRRGRTHLRTGTTRCGAGSGRRRRGTRPAAIRRRRPARAKRRRQRRAGSAMPARPPRRAAVRDAAATRCVDDAPHERHGLLLGRRRNVQWFEGDVRGWMRGCSSISCSNVRFTHSMIGATDRKFWMIASG